MKNKILLLFVLLIPSLGFSQSVHVQIVQDKEKDTILINFNSSIKVENIVNKFDPTKPIDVLQTQVVFKTHKGVIYPQGNDTEKVYFMRLFGKVLKLAETRSELMSFFSQSRTNLNFVMFIEMWMIKEGFAVTHKSTLDHLGEDIIRSEFHFFKPEK